MAGDWIKMRTNLLTHPKIVRIASALKADRHRTVGGIYSVWCLFDEHSIDGHLSGYTPETLDELVNFSGICAAMQVVGWVNSSESGLSLPEFDTHNGQSAKRRAQEADRKRADRKTSADDADKKRTRGEKSRGEKKNTSMAVPACPHDQILDRYAEILPDLAQPTRSLWRDGKNAVSLKARWEWVMTACHEKGQRKGLRLAETAEDGVAWFGRFFDYIGKSDHLSGRKTDWACDLIWSIKKSNFEKIIQGTYENRDTP